jgi:hypothetical protein
MMSPVAVRRLARGKQPEVTMTSPVAVGRGARGKQPEVTTMSPVAVGRGARGKQTSSHLDRSIEEFEMATEGNNMDIEVAAVNPFIVTNTPMTNHGIGTDKVFLRTPVTNTGGVIEEEQVCWLCGGTPCDWLEYLAKLLKEINNRFPTDVNGNRIDASLHEIVSMNQIRYTLYHAFTYARYGHLGKNNRIKLGQCVETKIKELFPNRDGQEYTGFLPANEPVNL